MASYPSLEGLTIGKEVLAQNSLAQQVVATGPQRANYDQLASYFLGLDLSSFTYDDYGNIIPNDTTETAIQPVIQSAVVVKRDPVEVSNAVREIKLSKNGKGRVGMQLRACDNGVFVTFVEHNSPAAQAGLRFGDQVLKINDELVASYSSAKAMDLVTSGPSRFPIVIRDRPLERVITLQKDSRGGVGFAIKDGKITQIVKDSSAARNGVLINHQLVEVNGMNVIGMGDKQIAKLLSCYGSTVKITVTPTFFFEHLCKKLGRGLLKKMDHSLPLV